MPVSRLLGRGARNALLALLLVPMALWAALAILYSNLPFAWLRALVAAAFTTGSVLAFTLLPKAGAGAVFLAAFAVVTVWFLLIPPSNDRDWQPDVALLPHADIGARQVQLHNIRNCEYRSQSDYTVRHYDQTLDLDKLRSADLYVVHWGTPLIAHTMMSFGFDDGQYLCFSIEARKEKGEAFSAIKGFFRQFELIYVLGDERDLVRLRTNFRGEDVRLYRLNADPTVLRLVFLEYLRALNRLKGRAEWYNAATCNCTTNIRGHTRPYSKGVSFDWRMLINGSVDQMAYERNALDHSLPFHELRAQSLINERARAADQDPAFSLRIREGRPGFPAVAP